MTITFRLLTAVMRNLQGCKERNAVHKELDRRSPQSLLYMGNQYVNMPYVRSAENLPVLTTKLLEAKLV